MATMLDAVGGSTSFNSTGLHLLQSSGSSSCCRAAVISHGVVAAHGAVADIAAVCGGVICCSSKRCSFPRRSPPLPSSSRRSAPSQLHRKARTVVSEAQETITAAGAVNDATFKSLVLECEIPVLVDFWAPWCGPCRMIAPIIDELARQYAGKLKCLKINTDESPGVAAEYGIRSIPTVIIFVNGQKRDTVIGAVPKSTLTATIDKYIES